jgi:hypothetical protein
MPIKSAQEFKEDFLRLISFKVWKENGAGKWFGDLENLIDDPIDWVKEKIHGIHLPFGYELNISFAMCNRKTTWDIIRKQGDYENSDPEDRSDHA